MNQSNNPFVTDLETHAHCREISTKHLNMDVMKQLKMWINIESLSTDDVLFDVFELSESDGWGIRLFETPWNDSNLAMGIDQLSKNHAKQNVPEILTDILLQAGLADIRVLIFDINAEILPGLNVHF